MRIVFAVLLVLLALGAALAEPMTYLIPVPGVV